MAEDKERTKYLGSRVPETLHRKFTALLRMQGLKYQHWITERIEEYIAKHWGKGRKPPS